MICNKCGSTIKAGMKYCTKCGADLLLSDILTPPQLIKKYCVKCGNYSGANDLCVNCEQKIRKTKKSNKKPIIFLSVVLFILLSAGACFGLSYLMNNKSGEMLKAALPKETETVVVNCSGLDSKVNSENDAYLALESVSGIFGFDDVKSVLKTEKIDVVDDDTYYRFSQKYNNIPVYGKSIVLSADSDGNVFNISGNYVNISEKIDTKPKISKEEAIKEIESKMKKEFTKDINISDPELIIFSSSIGNKPAWISNISGCTVDGSFKGYKIFIDSSNGEVLYLQDTVIGFQTQESYKGQKGDMKSVTVEESDSNDATEKYQLKDNARNIAVYIAKDEYNWYKNFVDGNKTSELVTWSGKKGPDKSAVDAMYNVSKSYDFYNDVLGHKGMDGNGGEIPVYVHVKGLEYVENGETKKESITNNAFFWPDPEPDILAFTVMSGNSAEYSAELDLASHEYTHGVVYNISGISGSADSAYERAINEAYADIMGVIAEGVINETAPDWNVVGLRDLKNPKNNDYPISMSEYDIAKKAYYNSSIISHTAYLMYNGIDGKGAIDDIETLGKLWYDSLYMLNSDSDFSHCRTAVEISAKRLFEKNELSLDQLECVSDAFNKTGIASKILYCEVTPDPELLVCASDNSEYYNYHYKVEKIIIKNQYNVGQKVKLDIHTVEESDVTDVKIVNLSSINDENCIYRITVSDLSEEPGTTQAKFVVVSDNAKPTVNFYTDYSYPAGELIDKIISSLDGVESYHLASRMENSVNYNDMVMNMDCDIDLKNDTSYMNVYSKSNGKDVNIETYVRGSLDDFDIFISANGMWLKQSGIKANDLNKLANGFEMGFEGIEFELNSMENIYVDSESDEQNYIITGIITSDNIKTFLEKGGFSAALEMIDEDDVIDDEDVQNILSNLSPVKLTYYVDKETFLPASCTTDMTDFYNSMIENMKKTAYEKYGEDVGDIECFVFKTTSTFSNYNNISEIIIPDEALNGSEYKFFESNRKDDDI